MSWAPAKLGAYGYLWPGFNQSRASQLELKVIVGENDQEGTNPTSNPIFCTPSTIQSDKTLSIRFP